MSVRPVRSIITPSSHSAKPPYCRPNMLCRPVVFLLRLLIRPFGYLAFVLALLALSATARLLGDANELGFFSGRLARTVWRYPEVTRRGLQMAWLVWALLLGIALSPLDPIASSWDEVALGAVALIFLWHRISDGHAAGR
jgi:hypothetical protein